MTDPTAPAERIPPNRLPGRRASWFELFFDLAFVTSVAQLTGALAADYGPLQAGQFAFGLLLLWWAWLGHTFHGTRFDEDRADQHALGMVQILAVVLIGYGASDAFGARGGAFALGMAAFKALLALAYLRERRRPGARGLVVRYGAIYLVQSALWLASLALPPPARWACWVAVLAIDMVSPFIVARFTHEFAPHPEHLPERFGLFTIVLLGEGVASSLHALSHGGELGATSLLIAALGALTAFLFWVGYFERARGHVERHAHSAEAGRSLRRWAYGHVPLYAGYGAVASGFVVAAGHAAHAAAPAWIFAGGLALAMIGLTMIGQARSGAPSAVRHYLLALAPLPFAFSGSLLVVAIAGCATAALQVLAARPGERA